MPHLPNLKRLRLEKALTHRELAQLTGVSRQAISSLESEESPTQARPSTMRKLARVLGVEPRELMAAGERV